MSTSLSLKIFVIILLGYCNSAIAQIPIPEWVVATDTLPIPETGFMQEMKTDDTGNVYVFWSNGGNTIGSSNGRLIKYNTSGVFQWENIIDSTWLYNYMELDPNGDVVVAGKSYQYQTNYMNKYASNGTLIWDTLMFNNNIIMDVAIDDSGNVVLASYQGDKFITSKFNSAGNFQWEMIDSTNVGSSYQYIVFDEPQNVYHSFRHNDPFRRQIL